MQRLSGFMRTYWTRGDPGRPTPRSLAVFMQRMWLLALAFKLLGSSWDVSWHFKWLRDNLAPPHDINTIGTGIAIGLVLAHTFTGYGAEKRSLRIMQWGTGIFVVAGPIDVINHRVNGLDLTAWSPSHLLLYFGTMVMVIGVVRNWYRTYPREGGRGWGSRTGAGPGLGQWRGGLILLFTFLFEDVFFPTGQQEYGVLEIASWLRGQPEAESSLLTFAAGQIKRPVDDMAIRHFAMPIPSWVYPIWVLVVCVLVLVVARMLVGLKYTATAVVGLYVGYRCLIWPLLVAMTFPASAVPLWLLPVGMAVDLVFLRPLAAPRGAQLRALIGGLVVPLVGYGALALAALSTGTPLALGDQDMAQWRADFVAGAHLWTVPIAWWTIYIAVPGLMLTWSMTVSLLLRLTGAEQPPPGRPRVGWAAEPMRGARRGLLGPVSEPAPGVPVAVAAADLGSGARPPRAGRRARAEVR